MTLHNLKGDRSLNAIIVDADSQALYQLEKQLTTLSSINIVGTYEDPFESQDAILTEDIDVVFLETLLPGYNGIVLAKQIQELQPNIQIVFVTTAEQYAIDAYNLNAIDYIIKPIRKERLEKTVQRLKYRNIKSS